MRILCLIDSLSSGGAQNQMVNLICGLVQKDYEIDLVTFYSLDFFEDRIKDIPNIRRIRLEKKDKAGLNIIMRLRTILKSNDYEFALSYLETPNFYLSIAKTISGNKSTIFITSERNATDFSNSKLVLQKKITHYLTDYLICNSYHEAEKWKKKFPKIKKKIYTIYNGIDLNRFAFLKKENYKTYNMLCVASVIPRKNALYIVEALNILKNKYSIEINFSWIGQQIINDNTNEYFEKVNNLLEVYGIKDQWKWIPPTKNIRDLYANNDALILASYKEGVPNVICESLAMGLPVFAGDILDHPYLLSEPERGYLFDLKEPEDLADKIFDFYNIPQIDLENMSRNQRSFAEDNLSIDYMINNYHSFFKNKLV